jgi:hypothetical protein
MFEHQMTPLRNTYLTDRRCSQNLYALQYNTALNQFRATLFKGKLSRLKRRMLGHPQQLYDLNVLKQDLSLRSGSYSGIQVVPIRSIIGSEGRTADFDMDFRPISESARERWVNMAIAYLGRITLPPIQLIQVGDAYFVRDGHHRISVSRAFGQIAMDAEVITWKASPPFPWQPCCVENPSLVKSLHLST